MTRFSSLPSADLAEAISASRVEGEEIRLWWLGQAGFVLRSSHALLAIDPYLSNFLEKKYARHELTHKRMAPAPIRAGDLKPLDLVLVTHRHSDHMDPETLPVLADNNPDCLFIIPRSEAHWSSEIGIFESRRIDINGDETFSFTGGSVTAVASAHEELIRNDKGEHFFLGYIIRMGNLTIYHSGDCVPYPGLARKLKQHAIDLALLPVNGRDEFRRSRNIPGNFTLKEAMDLCLQANIAFLLGHHYGMFAFNTIDAAAAEETFQKERRDSNCMLARLGQTYRLSNPTGLL